MDSGADRIGATVGLTGALKREIARMIDHTVLKPDADEKTIVKLCTEADKYGFASVCVNPCWIKLCRELVKNPEVKICGVAGFPLGANTTIVKAAEANALKADRKTIMEPDIVAAIAAVTGSTSNLPFLFKQLEALNAKDTAALSDMIQTWVDAH